MRIRFERSGGFTGIGLSSVIETDQLNADVASELRELVDGSGFFALTKEDEEDVVGGSGGDQFQYTLQIDDGDRSGKLRIGDENSSPELTRLLRRLTVLSRSSS